MEKIDLSVSERDKTIRAALLRRDKKIPAVVYGHGFENLSLMMDYQTFRRTFQRATYSTIITLNVEGKNAIPVLVHQVQYHPVTDEIVHVDFYAVRMDQKVTTHIAFDFVGESEAVKLGAVLNTTKHAVEVSCLPGDLVHNIEVDISVLKEIGDTIRISDIAVPKGVEFLVAPEDPIVSAIEPKIIEEEEPEVVEGEEVEGEEGEAGEEGAEGEGEGEKKEGGEEANKEGDKKEGDKKEKKQARK